MFQTTSQITNDQRPQKKHPHGSRLRCVMPRISSENCQCCLERKQFRCFSETYIRGCLAISMVDYDGKIKISLSIYLYLYLSIHQYVYLSINLSIYLTIYQNQSIYQAINRSIYQTINLSIYQSIFLSINLFIYQTMY